MTTTRPDRGGFALALVTRSLVTLMLLASALVGTPAWGSESLGDVTIDTSDPRVSASDGIITVTSDADAPVTIPLAVIEPVALTQPLHVIWGRIAYEDLPPGCHLEAWHELADGGSFFTRTLETAGPAQALSGSSDWRPFAVSFNMAEQDPAALERIRLGVVLEGPGTVQLRDIERWQYASATEVRAPGTWWPDEIGGLLGGFLGPILGLALAAAIFAGMGQQFWIGYILAGLCLICGVAFLGVGIYAYGDEQPYAVYYPLVMLGFFGVMDAIAIAVLLPHFKHRAEQRRMEALDQGVG